MSTALLTIETKPGFPLTIQAEAIALKEKSLLALSAIKSVDAETLNATAGHLSVAAGIIKRMENSRVEVKAPVLDLGRRIDKMAADFSGPMQDEYDRVKKLVSGHQEREAARVAEENRKREEAERKEREAAEKIRREEAAIAEAKYQAEQKAIREAAAAEQARLAEEAKKAEAAAKAIAKKKDDGMKALREAAAQAERERLHQEAEAARIETERQLAVAQEERSRIAAKQEAERIAEASRISVPVVQAKAEGVSSRKVWKFEVIDPKQVYLARPDLCSVAVLPAQVNCRIAEGLRDCPGLRIFETTETKVRAA